MIGIALRANVWPALAMAALTATFFPFLVASYTSLAGDRATLGRDLEGLATGFSFILPLPSRLDTLAGYIEWFGFGQLVPILAMWALIAGTGASRAEEERGLVDQWLAAGVPRWRIVLSQTVGFAVGAAGALSAGGSAAWLAAWSAGEPLGAGGLVAQSSGLLALILVMFAVGLLAGQLSSTRRSAAGAGAVAVVSLFFLNSFSRQADGLVAFRWPSPFSWYDRVHGLVPGTDVDVAAVLVLAGAAAVIGAAAIAAFAGRDAGATLFTRPGTAATIREPSSNPLLRTPLLAALYDQRVALGIWSLAVIGECYFISRLARPFLSTLAAADPNDPATEQLRVVAGAGHGTPYEGFLGFEWFGGIFAFGLAAFAITQVTRWAADDVDGRLEALLSAPLGRTRVVVERAASLLVGAALLVSVGHVALAVAAWAEGIDLDPGRMAIASLMLVPVAGAFGGIGAAASALRPRIAIFALSAFAFVSFMIPFATPVIRAPEWVRRLSVFDLYGTPLADGLEPWRLATLTGLTLFGFVAAGLALGRRDVGR